MKIAILTNLTGQLDPISIVNVVRNQVETLSRYKHEVTICVCKHMPLNHFAKILPYRHSHKGQYLETKIAPILPAFETQNYVTVNQLSDDHKAVAHQVANILVEYLKDYDIVFTHDWINNPLHLPLSEALRIMTPQSGHLAFLHWIHSVPCDPKDWWTIHRYGLNHKIIYPTPIDRPYVADAFNTGTEDIRVIPHIVDLRNFYEMSEEAQIIIDRKPGLLDATFVQIYPAARDRLEDKGIKHLIYIYKELKKRRFNVCVGIIDSWTGRRKSEDIEYYRRVADRNGLTEDDFWFLSEFQNYMELSHTTVRELMEFANIFIYPTQGEAFGLVLPEAILAGGTLPILNRHLPMMLNQTGGSGLYFDFGSNERPFNPDNPGEYYNWITKLIISRAQHDDCFLARTYIRKTFNMDVIYRTYYVPLFEECKLQSQMVANA